MTQFQIVEMFYEQGENSFEKSLQTLVIIVKKKNYKKNAKILTPGGFSPFDCKISS